MTEEKLQCQNCDSKEATRQRQNTQYVEDERNYVILCPKCAKENAEYWADMWDDYYSNVL